MTFDSKCTKSLSNKFAASTSVHAQDKNKLIHANLPTSVSNNKS